MFNTSTSMYTLILWKSACQRFLHISDLSKKIKERNVDPIPTNTQLKDYPSQHFSTQIFLIGSIHFITTVFMWYSQVWLWKTNWGGFDLADFFLTFNCHINVYLPRFCFLLSLTIFMTGTLHWKKVHIKLNMYACYHINYFKSF